MSIFTVNTISVSPTVKNSGNTHIHILSYLMYSSLCLDALVYCQAWWWWSYLFSVASKCKTLWPRQNAYWVNLYFKQDDVSDNSGTLFNHHSSYLWWVNVVSREHYKPFIHSCRPVYGGYTRVRTKCRRVRVGMVVPKIMRTSCTFVYTTGNKAQYKKC